MAALLKNDKTRLLRRVNEQRAEFLEDQLKPILHLLATLAEDAAASTNPMKDDPTGRLLRKLLDVYERATGEPARTLTTDRITGEIRGPLLDFILIAAQPVFAISPPSHNAIKKRLLTLQRRKGRHANKVVHSGTVQSERPGTNSTATKCKRVVAHAKSAAERSR